MTDTEKAPKGHEIKWIESGPSRTTIKCECGARWTVENVAYNRGDDHIKDHWHYASKKFTRVD